MLTAFDSALRRTVLPATAGEQAYAVLNTAAGGRRRRRACLPPRCCGRRCPGRGRGPRRPWASRVSASARSRSSATTLVSSRAGPLRRTRRPRSLARFGAGPFGGRGSGAPRQPLCTRKGRLAPGQDQSGASTADALEAVAKGVTRTVHEGGIRARLGRARHPPRQPRAPFCAGVLRHRIGGGVPNRRDMSDNIVQDGH